MKKSKNSIKQGDVFRLGNHVLACADARDTKVIERIVQGKKINAVISDMPYGISVTESKRGFSALAKDKVVENDHHQSDGEYRAFTRAWIEPVTPHLAQKNTFYLFNSDKMMCSLRAGMADVGVKFAQMLVWVKTSAVIGRMDYAPQHEIILYGWYGSHRFLKSKDKSVLVYPKPSKSVYHPTTKPIPLIRHLILNSTKIGDVVYDGFLGSGTTLLACEQTKRTCIGVEIDPEYCQTVINRFEKITGITAEAYE